MKHFTKALIASAALFLTNCAFAATHYVNLDNANPVAPFTDWSTAATNIQDAIDASTNGDLVLVTNGVYSTGGVSMDGVLTNRIALNKAVTVQSVNGPFVTTVLGAGPTSGPSAVRCAWLTNNAALIGFTLKWGATATSGATVSQRAGGVWGASPTASVVNCVIVSNDSAFSFGSGAYQANLENCLIKNNRSGVDSVVANNCTIVSNSGSGLYNSGGFVSEATNCIVYYNSSGFLGANFSHCCTQISEPGTGNLATAPLFFSDGVHLEAGSPCIGAGTGTPAGTDIFGQPWANPPSIGCVEFEPAPLVGTPSLQLGGASLGFIISNIVVDGQGPFTYSWLENGTLLENNGDFISTDTNTLLAVNITIADAGSYQLVVSNAFGSVTSAPVALAIHCVDANGANSTPPYLTWDTAATNIQDAIDSAAAGDIVLVTNGVYDTGGKPMESTYDGGGKEPITLLTNRVTLDKAVTVLSVNGYAATTIQGAWDPQQTVGPFSVRCAWVTNGAVLKGFTLANGSTLSGGVGGGALCSSTNAIVSNCLLTNNVAGQGGGIAFGTINNSLLVYNLAGNGQAAYNATLNQCTVWGGDVESIAYTFGDGTSQCQVRNSVVLGYNYNFDEGVDTYNYSCTEGPIAPVMPTGVSNINADLVNPQFLDLYHLQSTSPCRAAGNPLYSAGTDIDGQPWANPPSMGCSEFVPASRSGPLIVSIFSVETNVVVNDFTAYEAIVSDTASSLSWSYNDGTTITITNTGNVTGHTWTNAGNQSVTVTAYNESYPNGVSATLPVNVFPSPITNFPAFVTAYVDGNVTFDTITPIPRWDPPYSLQWYFNGTALTNDGHYAGTQSGALTISNVQLSDAGNYYLTASNYNVSGSNLVDVLSVTAAIIAPGFLSQPQSLTNFVGSNALFSATPSGTQPILYQWQFDGTNISGATDATLELTNLSYVNAGSYAIILSNSAGTNISQPATLTVVTSPPVLVNLTPQAGAVVLQWPSSGGTNLLATPDLTQPWVPAGLPIISSNFMNSVAVPIGTASQFFRLLQ